MTGSGQLALSATNLVTSVNTARNQVVTYRTFRTPRTQGARQRQLPCSHAACRKVNGGFPESDKSGICAIVTPSLAYGRPPVRSWNRFKTSSLKSITSGLERTVDKIRLSSQPPYQQPLDYQSRIPLPTNRQETFCRSRRTGPAQIAYFAGKYSSTTILPII